VEIVTQDDPSVIGRRNVDLAASAALHHEGGSWKSQRTIALLPAGKNIPTRVAVNHRNIISPPNQPFAWQACIGEEVGQGYSLMLDALLEHPELRTWDYVLTVEHDNLVPPDAYVKLLRSMEAHPEYAAISALYWTKGETGVPQIWGDVRDPVVNYRPQSPEPGRLVECYGLGMGFVLHRMSMFRELAERKLERPWWKTRADVDGVNTQDIYFWQRVRPLGYRCAVDCDVKCGHLDTSTGIVW